MRFLIKCVVVALSIAAALGGEEKQSKDSNLKKRGLLGLELAHEPFHFHAAPAHVITKEVHVPVPHPVGYPVEKKVPFPVKVPVPVPVDRPYPVPVPSPYPVHVEKRVPVPVDRPVPYPVHVPVKVPYAVPQPYPVPKPYPVPVHVPKPIAVHVAQPVIHAAPVIAEDHGSAGSYSYVNFGSAHSYGH